MRGKESGCVPGLPGSRITPAHAGKRDKTAIFEEWCRDHPCVCGEKTKPVPAGGILMGSPPRVRGKGPAGQILVVSVGITPAYAGKRRSDWIIRSTYWDHPRVCGEKFWALVRAVMALGSPPRVRGKGYDVVGRLGGVRITPACAGKRPKSRKNGPNTWDHPRVCGEKLVEAGRISQEEGSPPRVRGKVPSSI